MSVNKIRRVVLSEASTVAFISLMALSSDATTVGTPAAVPEPTTIGLIAVGLGVVVANRKRRG